MGTVVVGAFVSVDGVYQAPGGYEDRDGGFTRGGWTSHHWDDELGARVAELTVPAAALLLGRRTYEELASYWPHASPDDPVAATLNRVPKYVASRTLEKLNWHNSTRIEGDVATAVAALRAGVDGPVHVVGSGNLLRTLLRHDLVDEYALIVFPLLLGAGKRLFGDTTPPGTLRLVESWTSPRGVCVQTYRTAGDLPAGTAG